MALSVGTRLGPYEVLAPLGAGGMGEVYKARDTRLDRIVAIKILPEALAADPQFRDRFDREARAISQLTHPHICTLYDVGEQAGAAYLVMELLDGETLTARLARGALPLNEALTVAIQIASALDKAHRAGITHRDLKPGNIMLTKSGAKLLDFGLAKASTPPAAGVGLSMLPTTPAHVTAQGTILGTFQYMAPEQLEGQEADARTDIFAFGAVLYEMLTGRKAFEGKSHASLIGAILKDEPPPVSQVQPIAPPMLDRVVKKCLAKDPDARWQSAHDLHDELQWVAESARRGPEKPGAAEPAWKRWARPVPAVAAGLIAVVAAAATGVAVWMIKSAAPQASSAIARLTVTLPAGDELGSPENPALALSPDGARLVYVGKHESKQQLYVKALDTLESTPIAGTEEATNPFFSPDGQWVGFFSQGKLKRVSVAAGAVQNLADAPNARGGSWGPDNTIYFAPGTNSGLWKVSASGGVPQEITKLDRSKGEVSHRWPQVLPGGKAVLFTVWTGPGRDERYIHAQPLQTGERRVLVQGGETGRYVSPGYLIYSRGDALLAVPFDLGHLEATSSVPTPLPEVVRTGGEGAQYAVSDTGELIYQPGSVHRTERRLVWVDRRGKVEALPIPARPYSNPVLSPDGHRAAVTVEEGTIEIWIYDFDRAALTRLTTGGSSQAPVWTPDGTRLAYRGTRTGFRNLFWKAVDSTGAEERLTTKEDNTHTPASFSPDGEWLAYSDSNPATGQHIWLLRLDGDRRPQSFVTTASEERNPQFSPDGRWVAHTSNESGRVEIYVQAFPDAGRKWSISTSGGTEPRWSRNGRELFYLDGDKLMVVDITTQPTFSAGSPRLLVQGRFVSSNTGTTAYDVSPDGQRFLRIQAVEPEPPANQIHVVMNWFAELKQLAASRR